MGAGSVPGGGPCCSARCPRELRRGGSCWRCRRGEPRVTAGVGTGASSGSIDRSCRSSQQETQGLLNRLSSAAECAELIWGCGCQVALGGGLKAVGQEPAVRPRCSRLRSGTRSLGCHQPRAGRAAPGGLCAPSKAALGTRRFPCGAGVSSGPNVAEPGLRLQPRPALLLPGVSGGHDPAPRVVPLPLITAHAVTAGSPASPLFSSVKGDLKRGFSSGISWETQQCRSRELFGGRKAICSLVNASPANGSLITQGLIIDELYVQLCALKFVTSCPERVHRSRGSGL